MLAGIKHLYLVPDDLLRSLPFYVLVTEPPAELANEDYRSVHWLARDYAVTLLPMVASLRSVAVLPHQPEAPKNLIAFADPVLSGKRDKGAPRGASLVTRDRLAAPDAVRSLPSLPDTRTEVEEVCLVGWGRIRRSLFRRARHRTRGQIGGTAGFANRLLRNHALLPDEYSLAQPAIVLIPPETATAEDDGLLTADEIGALRLNADWVVLSACNTAGPVGRGLSGLARAFLFAGAKALLVSNCYWRATRLPGRWHPHSTSSPATRRSAARRRCGER
jgi:CHAT domain-containing protein